MKNIFTSSVIVVMAAAALCPGAPALTQNVTSSDSAATIQAAIDAVLASADPTGEVVFASGTYVLNASLTVNMNNDGQITLRGADPNNRPILICPDPVALGETWNAQSGTIALNGTGTTITIRDMIFIPTHNPADQWAASWTKAIAGMNGLNNCTLNFIDLLICGNNGANQPVSLNGDINANPANHPNITRFGSAGITLDIVSTDMSTLVIGATRVVSLHNWFEGMWCDGNSGAAYGGPRKAHYYDCVFNWNRADGFRHAVIGSDDQFYRCQFNYNGTDTINQGVHNSGWNPGGVTDGVGGRSIFDNCEASYNSNRGFYIGASENTVVRDCTAINNGNFFPVDSDTSWGFEWVTGQGNWLGERLFAAGNRGGTLQVNIAGDPDTTVIVRNVISLSNGVNNTSAVTDAFTGRSAVRVGGRVNVLEDIYVDNCPALGIWTDSNVADQPNMNIQVRRCLVRNCGMSGILIWRSGPGSTVVLENLQLENTSNNSAAITNSINRGNGLTVRAPGVSNNTTITVDNVSVDGAVPGTVNGTGNGIRIEASASSTGMLSVSNVTIRNCSNNGLSLAGGNISLTNAKITNVLNCGVEIAAASPVTMATVEVIGAVNHGITLGQETEGTPSTPLLIGGLEYLSLVNCATSGVRVFSNQINSPAWTLDHTTIFNCGSGFKMQATNFQSQPVDIQNTIIAGTGKTGIDVVTTLTSPITVHHSGLVQQGVYALGTSVIDVNNPSIVVLGSNVVTADPVFAGVTPGLPDFLDVRSTAYGGQGTGGSNLSGRWDYIGDFVNIEAWRRF